ncbi:hypothetical protein PN432_00185 [Microcystis aeruginosa CS-579]|nr:hypothetical protein [Microcystis aeruginosa CS-579]
MQCLNRRFQGLEEGQKYQAYSGKVRRSRAFYILRCSYVNGALSG